MMHRDVNQTEDQIEVLFGMFLSNQKSVLLLFERMLRQG